FSFFLFFFQAEDGIRDFHVTGVQTCALPISHAANWNSFDPLALSALPHVTLLELPASAAPSPGGASCVCCVHPEPGAPPVVSTARMVLTFDVPAVPTSSHTVGAVRLPASVASSYAVSSGGSAVPSWPPVSIARSTFWFVFRPAVTICASALTPSCQSSPSFGAAALSKN